MLRMLLSAVLALASCANTRPARPYDAAAVVRIFCAQPGAERGSFGTAFHIGGGRWLSVAHVTVNGPCRIVPLPTREGMPAPVAMETIAQDVSLDFSELRGPASPHALAITCDGFRARRTYRATGWTSAISAPIPLRLVLPWEAMNWKDPDNQNAFIGEAIPGMSGGPVIDDDGRAVGVINMRHAARSRTLGDTHICRSNP